jgi:hypothetical protein
LGVVNLVRRYLVNLLRLRVVNLVRRDLVNLLRPGLIFLVVFSTLALSIDFFYTNIHNII